MYELDAAERVVVAERVVERVAGRVPVIASGTFGDTREELAAGVRRMADTGVMAVVCLTNALAGEGESEDTWRSRAAELLDDTGEIPLGLYECPQPQHRLLPPDTVAWAAATGRFLFLKETSGEARLLGRKLAAVHRTPLRVFNADAASLLPSLRAGAAGFCGISANFVPELWVWLCRHAASESDTAERLQSFLREAEPVIARHYPASAKHYVMQRDIPMLPVCRTDCVEPTTADREKLQKLRDKADAWRAELGIA
jgi:4-hydroxy-tetrahydrodipicolinate synthase